MNPFELHPDAYPEEQHPKQERKKWGKKEPEPINAEEMAALGFRKEPGKFSSHDENAAERNQLLVTDNILQEDYQDALEEAGESEEDSNSIERFIKKASSKDLDILKQSLSNLGDMMKKEEGSDEEYGDDFEEIEEDVNEDKSDEEDKAETKDETEEMMDDIIEDYGDDSDEFDRQIEMVESTRKPKQGGGRQIVSARTGDSKPIAMSFKLGQNNRKQP